MNHTKRYLSSALVLILCLTSLTGCSRRSNTVTDPTAQPINSPTVQEDIMGLVNYVSDSSVAISVYTAEGDLTDLGSIDPKDWTATDTTRYIPVDDSTEYYRTDGATPVSIRKDDLSVGDFITAATVDGVLRITRIDKFDVNSTDNEIVPTAIPAPMTEGQAEDRQS